MKVLTNILKVKDEDQVQVIAEEEEDMYTLFNLIAKGDIVEALTVRNVRQCLTLVSETYVNTSMTPGGSRDQVR
jgi:stalled ribosome rescue protein Dom34